MESSIPWIEKYRPDRIETVMLDDQIKKQIDIFIHNNSNTHLIITGPPGVGKTTTVRCIARAVIGDNMEGNYLELNAAEDRGVKSIGAIVPSFCMRMTENKARKIILLDEADNITEKCQYDINDMMKKFGKSTKFIFTCNDSNKIIQDIQSVCRIIRYKSLSDNHVNDYLISICEKEDVKFDKKGLDTIRYISNGDMRKAINSLQVTAYSFPKITKKNVLEACKLPDPDEIKEIIDLCIDQNLSDSVDRLKHIINDGYYYLDIVTAFHTSLVLQDLSEDLRIALYEVVNETKINISSGLKTKLQLIAMVCRLISTSKSFK